MKNVLFFLMAITLVLVSCKKSEDSPVYTQAKLSGIWENIVLNEDGCKNQLVISDTSLVERTVCANYTGRVYYDSYSFDGKTISVKMGDVNAAYEINELTETKLVATCKVFGFSEKNEYKRIIE